MDFVPAVFSLPCPPIDEVVEETLAFLAEVSSGECSDNDSIVKEKGHAHSQLIAGIGPEVADISARCLHVLERYHAKFASANEFLESIERRFDALRGLFVT